MTDMIERVAMAISGAPFPSKASLRKARAAIEAMREPTDAMEEAADDPVHAELKKQRQFSVDKYGTPAFASYPFSVVVWRAMIDAALAEEKAK